MRRTIIMTFLFISLIVSGQADSTATNKDSIVSTYKWKDKAKAIIKSDRDRLDKQFALADLAFNMALGFDPAVRLRKELTVKKQDDDKRKSGKVD